MAYISRRDKAEDLVARLRSASHWLENMEFGTEDYNEMVVYIERIHNLIVKVIAIGEDFTIPVWPDVKNPFD